MADRDGQAGATPGETVTPAPQPAPADKVREEFEAGMPPEDLERGPDGDYGQATTFWRWEGWLASRNQTIKRVKEIVVAYGVASGHDTAVLLAELDRELGAGEGR